jgi:hypothetical protein
MAQQQRQQQQHVNGNGGGGDNMHDTVETTAFGHRPITSSSTATAATAGEKVCCHCGKNVAGQKRFKDADGRYWCYDCGVEDHVRKHPEEGIACAGCGGKFAPTQLTEFEQQVYCEPCGNKRKQQKRREEARKAAAAADAAASARKWKLMLASAAAAAVAGVGFAVWTFTR